MQGRLLGLGLNQELSIEADLLGVVHTHMEELGHVVLFALHLGVPEGFVSFAPTPEDIVLGAQALADLKAVLELARGIGIDVGEG